MLAGGGVRLPDRASDIGVLFAVIAASFAILFTGCHRRGIFDFVVGVMRWTNRVGAYACALVTHR